MQDLLANLNSVPGYLLLGLVAYSRHLPVLLHDIDPLVDKSRDLPAGQVAAIEPFEIVGDATLAPGLSKGVPADFQTDGRVLVIAERGMPVGPEVLGCLNITRPESLAMSGRVYGERFFFEGADGLTDPVNPGKPEARAEEGPSATVEGRPCAAAGA